MFFLILRIFGENLATDIRILAGSGSGLTPLDLLLGGARKKIDHDS